ncbi:hypothetical protein NZJ93_10210 [Desulfofundulus thermocisternus]|nr:hypothetical protein [Desulfofundulus thermocisternus]
MPGLFYVNIQGSRHGNNAALSGAKTDVSGDSAASSRGSLNIYVLPIRNTYQEESWYGTDLCDD